jgi:hypothetical protein
MIFIVLVLVLVVGIPLVLIVNPPNAWIKRNED